MSELSFSILVPVYNVEKYLEECLKSILNQTYNNYEVILVNDGSTDLSEEICKKYVNIDKRIKLISQNNKGLIMARRTAVKYAKGEFCLFLDSDDYWDKNLLEEVNNCIIHNKCDVVLYKYKLVSESNRIISEAESLFEDNKIFNKDNKEVIFKEILRGSKLNNLVCKAVKRNLLYNLDYNIYKNIKNGEDLLQSLPIIYGAENIVYMDKALYNYRVSDSSITRNFNINMYKDINIVREVVLEYLKKLDLDNRSNMISFYQFYLTCILNYVINLIHNKSIDVRIKEQVLFEIKGYNLFIDSIKYIDNYKFNKYNKFLIKKIGYKNYNQIYFYSYGIYKFKIIKNFFYSIMKGK